MTVTLIYSFVVGNIIIMKSFKFYIFYFQASFCRKIASGWITQWTSFNLKHQLSLLWLFMRINFALIRAYVTLETAITAWGLMSCSRALQQWCWSHPALNLQHTTQAPHHDTSLLQIMSLAPADVAWIALFYMWLVINKCVFFLFVSLCCDSPNHPCWPEQLFARRWGGIIGVK